MKANELMLNDWYQWYAEGRYYPYQVKAEDFAKDYVANFEPIPLTEETLKANEFIKSKDGRYYYAPNDGRFILGFMGGYANLPTHIFVECGFYPVIIKNIHELQHALRLCGLKEIADNLKVE